MIFDKLYLNLFVVLHCTTTNQVLCFAPKPSTLGKSDTVNTKRKTFLTTNCNHKKNSDAHRKNYPLYKGKYTKFQGEHTNIV